MLTTRIILLVAAATVSTLLLPAATTSLAAFAPPDRPDPAVTPTPTPVGPGPERVIDAIATAFDVSPDEVRAYHEDGIGFGELYRAYSLAEATRQSVEAILARREAGAGWGELYAAAGLHPGGRGLGAVMGQGHEPGTANDRDHPRGGPKDKPGKDRPGAP